MTRVAIQGIRGSYSEEAVREIFGSTAVIVECIDFGQTFAAVRDGAADTAVVPLKNKIVGDIREVFRHAFREPLELSGAPAPAKPRAKRAPLQPIH